MTNPQQRHIDMIRRTFPLGPDRVRALRAARSAHELQVRNLRGHGLGDLAAGAVLLVEMFEAAAAEDEAALRAEQKPDECRTVTG